MINPYSHFHLYAKGWYKRSDNIEKDLLKILSSYSGVDLEYCTVNDLVIVLGEAVWDTMEKSGNIKNNFFKFMGYNTLDQFYKTCLSILCLSRLDYMGSFDEPDYSILPESEG